MGTLLEAYQQRVFSLCSRMVNNREDAADLTQEALTKMLTGLAGFDGRAALSTWVYRLAMNTCISHLRRKRTARAGGKPGMPGPAGTLDSEASWSKSALDPEPTGEENVQSGEQRSMLLRALSGLGDEARALLVLRDGRGLEYETIAEVLELPVGTVKSRLFRARLALRKSLQEMESQTVRSPS